MLIVTSGSKAFEPILRLLTEHCERLGYRCLVFDTGGLGWGEPFHVSTDEIRHHDIDPLFVVSGTFKPRMLLAALDRAEPDEVCLWVDGDAVVIRPLDALGSMAFDVAFTLRSRNEVGNSHPYTNYLNAGVIGARNNARARGFLSRLDVACRNEPSEQAVMNRMVGPDWNSDDWRWAHGKTVDRDGVLIKILDCAEWNNWNHLHAPPPETKILHFKRGIRAMFNEKRCRELLSTQ